MTTDHSRPMAAPPYTVDDRCAGRLEEDWWYYARRRIRFYPGVRKHDSGEWLSGYYSDWQGRMGPLRLALNAVTWTLYHLLLPWRARAIARRYGLDDRWVRHAIRIGRQYVADPHDVALFRIDSAAQLHDHVRLFEYPGIHRLINPRGWQRDCVLGNKLSFHNICHLKGLPHPVVYAVVRNRKATVYSVPPDGQVVLKPTGGQGGHDFRLITWTGGESPRSAAFAARIQSAVGGSRRTWMVQQKLATHRCLLPLAGKALLTARLITVFNEVGRAEPCLAALRFPATSGALVDNIGAGGLMAPIDLQTGRLGLACVGRGVHELNRHPVSGVQIEGWQVPDWHEAVSLGLRAHEQAFAAYALIGWDLAITDSGPVLLEGDSQPSINLAQRAQRCGLGATRAGELIRYHIDAAIRRRDTSQTLWVTTGSTT